jgi:AcrR family transcriptional regulator
MSPNTERRNLQSQRAIVQAAYELAVETGPAKVTIEGIAARAGVGKQTIYRWWPSKGAVLLEAYNTAVHGIREITDTGDIISDLRTQIRATATLLSTDFGRFYAGLIAEAQFDPDLASSLAESIRTRAEAPRRQRLEKAQQQGQIRGDINVTTAVEMLYAPLHYRLLLHTAPLDDNQVDALIDMALNGLATGAAGCPAETTGPPGA